MPEPSILTEDDDRAVRNDGMSDGYGYVVRAGDPATEVSGVLPFSLSQVEPGITCRR